MRKPLVVGVAVLVAMLLAAMPAMAESRQVVELSSGESTQLVDEAGDHVEVFVDPGDDVRVVDGIFIEVEPGDSVFIVDGIYVEVDVGETVVVCPEEVCEVR